MNVEFRPSYVGVKKIEYFKVFNCYGQLLFKTSVIGKGWDGSYKGRMQNIDNYVFIIKATDNYVREKQFKGNVMLLR